MRIVFMGTPDFAVPCLKRLIDLGEEVVGVFTQPDKPKGRGYQTAPPPVKELALRCGLPVYQPAKMRDGEALAVLQELRPDLIVVVAYGKILPKEILDLPPLGCINVHGSLLPRYRGAGPIQWSVINGEAVTGVTTMYMDVGMDTGDMILKAETPIGEEETAGELFDRLCLIGADCLADTLALLKAGKAPRTPQDEAQATYAPMLTRELARLDFARPARELHNLVRGTSPWPTAHTAFRGKLLKVHRARVAEGFSGEPGVILDGKRLIVGCGEGALELLEVQQEGAKRMSAADFMNGKRVSAGEKFDN